MATDRLVLAFFLSLVHILSPVAEVVVNFGEGKFFPEWSASDKFMTDYCTEIPKNSNEDFIILKLTDIQLKDDLLYEDKSEQTAKIIDA